MTRVYFVGNGSQISRCFETQEEAMQFYKRIKGGYRHVKVYNDKIIIDCKRVYQNGKYELIETVCQQ